MLKSITTYLVHIHTTVDRPELRCPSYAVVPAGTVMRNVWRTTSYNAAVSEMERCVGGEYDTYGELVTRVWVTAEIDHRRLDPKGHRIMTIRNVRLPVSRQRQETTLERHRMMLKIGAARRGSLLTFKPFWAVTLPTVAAAELGGSETLTAAA